MGNVYSVVHDKKNGRLKLWKKIKQNNDQEITDLKNLNCKIAINLNEMTNNDIDFTDALKQDKILDSWDQNDEIENVISPQNVANQVVSLVRDSLETALNKKLSTSNETDININEIIEKYQQISTTDDNKIDKNKNKYKNNNKKKNDLVQIIKDDLQKSILKKDSGKYFLIGNDYCSGDDDNLLLLQSVSDSNLATCSNTKNKYLFSSMKRQKCVRFHDKVIIVYYSSAECQQQRCCTQKNGTFLASVEEPLKIALQQQLRNRELRNKFAYTHTVFPAAIRVGKN